MTPKTRQMPRKSQVAFANAWLGRQDIDQQTVDIESMIDGSLSYGENIANIRATLKLEGKAFRGAKKGKTVIPAAECDVHIGNYQAGFNHGETEKACICGDPDACDDLEEKKPTPAPKKPYVEEHPELKKKPAKKKLPKTISKSKLKLSDKQLNMLIDNGFVTVKINGKKCRITPKQMNTKGEVI